LIGRQALLASGWSMEKGGSPRLLMERLGPLYQPDAERLPIRATAHRRGDTDWRESTI
jgi:hypothetical protein